MPDVYGACISRPGRKFKLKPDWDYRELYGAVLEVCARSMDLEVFDIYTADGIMERVHRILGKS